MRSLFVWICIFGWLRSIMGQLIGCPKPYKVKKLNFNKRIRIRVSRTNTVCVLVHLRHSNTTDTSPLNVLSNSPSSDYILTPVARSYLRRGWEKVAGPYEKKVKVKKCNAKRCIMVVPKIQPYSTSGSFYLMSFKNLNTFEEELSRFFSQSTFGGTSDMIDNWSYAEDIVGMAQYLKHQVNLPLTSLRETYRKGVDFSLVDEMVGNSAVLPIHPCSKYSRWREYSLTGDDYGKPITAESIADGKLLLSVDGMPRTIVDSFTSTDSVLDGAGSYYMGYRAGGDIGGAILYKSTDSGYKYLDGGNPAVVMSDDAIAHDTDIVVINLPSRSNFEQIDAVLAPNLFEVPAGGSIRMKIDISNDSGSGCDAILNTSTFSKVLGKFPDNTYVWYNGYAQLENNTPDSPMSDGGKTRRELGVDYCANVPKGFLNIETCRVSEEMACAGSPHWYWSPQPFLENTVICGSPNEVSNDIDAPAAETSTYNFQGVSDNIFNGGTHVQKMAVWYIAKLKALDQFRQRCAWALSQLLVVTQNQIDNGNLWTEMFLSYEDIFIRNAFGNYHDVLREVSYSPMMGEMLSFVDSTSALYALQREGRVSRPDENFAREIMQLFTIGLYELNIDGTMKMSQGEPILSYDNTDIQTFARAWTGFRRQGPRSNYEGYRWNPNKIDPMNLDGEKRDPFPKMDLKGGFIGDGFPLCIDLPSRQFLRKGATYRVVGNWNKPELQPETNWWRNEEDTKRTILDPSSLLYEKICNANGGNKCNYETVVILDEDITCTGVECLVDTLSMIQIQDSPPIYYEYMPFPCIELGFSKNYKKVVDSYSKAMCVDPDIKDMVFDSCCPDANPNQYWYGKALSYCKYSGEKVSYSLNEERCSSYGGTVCDFDTLGAWGWNRTCGLGIPNWLPSWRWTNETCNVQVKVESTGLISIVHSPNFDINTVLEFKNKTTQTVYQPVSPENKNSFKVKWEEGAFPTTSNQCGSCQQIDNECLCDVDVEEILVFNDNPTVEEVLSQLKIGSPHPDWYERGYELFSTVNGVEIYMLPKDVPNFTKRTIFGVGSRYYRNILSYVSISSGSETFRFRNPSSLMSIIQQRTSDAYYETEAVLDHYIYHDNTAPFIASRMIQRLVTSNPSPNYIKRVANVFKNGLYVRDGVEFGDGVHGNLEALFAAILLDDEARSVVLDADPSFGSLKEPIIKLFAFMRAMEFQQNSLVPTLRMNNMISKIGQEPFATPNVFSFFLPTYTTGPAKAAHLTSPEAQVMNAPTIIGFLNGIMSMVDTGLNSCFGGFGLRAVNNCNGYQNNYNPARYSRGTLTFAPKNETAIGVVEELALLLNGGRLSKKSRIALEVAYNQAEQSGGKAKALRTIQKLFTMTPEFHSTSVFLPINESRPDPEQPDPSNNEYKGLVYINLNGGLDSFNVIVPHSNCIGGKDMFQEYQDVRQAIALQKNSLLTITATNQICSTFGIHEKLPFVHTLYQSGDLSFLANHGVLQQPVTDKEMYRELNKKTALFAHNTQQEEINSVDIYDDTAGIGICGRITDVLALNGYTPGTVSVAGGAPALVSKTSPLLVVNPYDYEKFNPINWEQLNTAHVKDINKATRVGSNLFNEIWSDKFFQAIHENDILYQEMSSVSLTTDFDNTNLGRQMSSIAKLIKTRDSRKTDRDAFYAELPGFDTHGKQEADLNNRLEEVNNALSSFVNEMKSQNLWNQVTVVVVSEFGRTLVSNTGNGSDHAWGGNYFIASGDLKGGNIFGTYPHDLTSSGSQIISDVGIVIPSTPWEALWNGVAQWFGISSENDLKSILPNRQPFENMLYTLSDLYN